MHKGNPVLNIQFRGQWCIAGSLYIYLLNLPSFSSRYFNKTKFREIARLIARNSLFGLLAVSINMICSDFSSLIYRRYRNA